MCEKSKDESGDAASQDKKLERSYYYDDAHGYEDFDPEAADREDADKDSA